MYVSTAIFIHQFCNSDYFKQIYKKIKNKKQKKNYKIKKLQKKEEKKLWNNIFKNKNNNNETSLIKICKI